MILVAGEFIFFSLFFTHTMSPRECHSQILDFGVARPTLG